MQRYKPYKIAVFVLAAIVIIETVVIVFLLGRPEKKQIVKIPVPVPAPAADRGDIAIVIDDWGYTLSNLEILRQIKYPLTLSVLPNLAYSQTISREAGRLKMDVILHFPMEPKENIHLEKNTILTSMGENTIRNILSKDLESVRYAKGVSNHMGSKATADSRIMAVIFNELSRRKLYFLDSYVSADSVCSALAQKIDLGFAKRDVFLDNKEEPEYIRGQMNKLKLAARAKGWSIGIGHDRKITMRLLKEMMPELEKEGYRFVLLSDLIRRKTE